MTRRLYYKDSYQTEFTAAIVDRLHLGDSPALVLDQTAFYPISGGQPCDTGFLGEARVHKVEEDDSGRVIHYLDRMPESTQVGGRIDWDRRFDHMQQHTGQHILSQAFLTVARAATLSFHLGPETSTIDLDLPQAQADVLRRVEDLAVRIVFEDRPVSILNVRREDLNALGVRKDSQREGEIRVIDIQDFDRSPCGGTHVRRCGEIGIIFILGSERYKGGARIEFACGGRALKAFHQDHDVLKDLGKMHSAHPCELPGLTQKYLAERSSLVRDKARLEGVLLEKEAQELSHSADKTGGLATVSQRYTDRKIEVLKILAQKLTASPRTIAILFSTLGTPQLVVARSADVRGDCGVAVRSLTARLGGRGGGRSELAQAGGFAEAALEEWSRALVDYFRTCDHDTDGGHS